MNTDGGVMTVEEQAIKAFLEISKQQTEKGLKRYGHLIEVDDPEYDWYEMAMAELVDAMRYLTALKMQRDRFKALLQPLLASDGSEAMQVPDNTNGTNPWAGFWSRHGTE